MSAVRTMHNKMYCGTPSSDDRSRSRSDVACRRKGQQVREVVDGATSPNCLC